MGALIGVLRLQFVLNGLKIDFKMKKEVTVVNPLTDLARRFLEAMTKYRITPYRMKIDGVINSSQIITKIKKGLQQPSRPTIEKFCATYGFNIAWVMTGQGDMKSDSAKTNTAAVPNANGIPCYRHDIEDLLLSMERGEAVLPESYIYPQECKAAEFWCHIHRANAIPFFVPGDRVAVKKRNDWKLYLPSGTVCCLVMSDGIVLRRVRKVPGDDQHLEAFFVNDLENKNGEKVPIELVKSVYEILYLFRDIKPFV